MRARLIVTILSILFLSLPFLAGAIDFSGLTAVPANPDPTDSRTSAWFIYALRPDETKNDVLVATNYSKESKTFDLYPADSTPTTGNGFALKQKSESMTGVGSWVKIETGTQKLAPNEEKKFSFSLTVPAGTAPGLYSGGLALAGPTAPEANGMALSLRLGVRIYVTVLAPAAANKTFSFFNSSAAIAALVVIIVAVFLLTFRCFKKFFHRKRVSS